MDDKKAQAKIAVYERVIDELQDARMMLEIAARGALALLQDNQDERSRSVCAALRAALQRKTRDDP